MKKEVFLYSLAGFVMGGLLIGIVASTAVNSNNQSIMRMMGMPTDNSGMMKNKDMTMGQMTQSLQSKTGDAFDEMFLSEMIMHHQGAIDMANLALKSAKRPEILAIASDIIASQSKEIGTMHDWQTKWGYQNTAGSQSHMMAH